MKVSIDLDGVCADFDTPFCELLEKVTGKPCPVEEPAEWEWPRRRGFTKDEEETAWTYIRSHPWWWHGLPRYEDSVMNFRDLRAGGLDLYFMTARRTPRAAYYSEEWLKSHYEIESPKVLTTKDKGLTCKALKINAHIDDRPSMLVDVRLHSPSTRCYLRARKHNDPMRSELERLGVVTVSSLQDMLTLELDRLRRPLTGPGAVRQ